MRKLIDKFNDIDINEKYSDDIKMINKTINILNQMLDNESIITNTLLDYIDDNIKYLDQKYDDLYDLVNIYDPIKIEYKIQLHKKYVNDLRRKNKKAKMGDKNEL